MESDGLLKSIDGQIAIGWLIVEDIVMVLVLLLLPALAGVVTTAGTFSEAITPTNEIWQAVGITSANVSAFIVLMLVMGRRVLLKVLWLVARTGSQELFILTVVAVAVGVAFGAATLFDVSFAISTIFTGMMTREAEFSHRTADETFRCATRLRCCSLYP